MLLDQWCLFTVTFKKCAYVVINVWIMLDYVFACIGFSVCMIA